MRPGETFEDADVVASYVHRPPYPDAVYARLVELSPARGALLDLGCGPGTVARRLAPAFASVTAVDASSAMLALARRSPGGDAGNVAWLHGLAEDVSYGGARFDAVVAAESIHWMDHRRLFRRLRRHVPEAHVFVVVEGDEPLDPPWQRDWERFLARWLPLAKGEPYAPGRKDDFLRRHEAWLEVEGEEAHVSAAFAQSIESFVACAHSRDAFCRRRLGGRAAAFDRELETLLAPHASDGTLELVVRTRITWGRIRPAPPSRRGDA